MHLEYITSWVHECVHSKIPNKVYSYKSTFYDRAYKTIVYSILQYKLLLKVAIGFATTLIILIFHH